MFCSIVCAQFRVLKDNLEKLNYKRNVADIKKDIKMNVQAHLQLLKACEVINGIFSFGVLGQFAGSIFVICFTSYELIFYSPDFSDFYLVLAYEIHLLSYMVCMLGQVAFYCYYGHNIMSESSDIGQSIYLSNWYDSDLKIRKELMIFMERVKKPIILTAGELFPLTVNTLRGILRSSYSFFAVLRQTK
ncbi:odorant receptor 85c-like [Sitophilus oryzae]|uniref:Odorant receptor 85c-like n=1 Tax=Sitophilus oryzae TaxID=7048 RepID=A0A6J2XUZ7_SITOR|nr:odorant receptor 85c-like [Sitophilus oryzae]